jgi:hypothetical protein
LQELWDGSYQNFDKGEMANPVHRVPPSKADAGKMRIRVFRAHNIDIHGVETVWRWQCPDEQCHQWESRSSYTVYWENAIRAAFNHVKWHRSRNAQV